LRRQIHPRFRRVPRLLPLHRGRRRRREGFGGGVQSVRLKRRRIHNERGAPEGALEIGAVGRDHREGLPPDDFAVRYESRRRA
ncbi:unnamed protein product, partial [Linum tenue]